jgi:hypothetical protein
MREVPEKSGGVMQVLDRLEGEEQVRGAGLEMPVQLLSPAEDGFLSSCRL